MSTASIKGKGKSAARRRRHSRGRKPIHGTAVRPRLAVSRSARHICAPVIAAQAGVTLGSASTMQADLRAQDAEKTEQARKAGEIIAQRADDAGVTQVVFDRAGHKYHGRIAAVADGAREGGLQL